MMVKNIALTYALTYFPCPHCVLQAFLSQKVRMNSLYCHGISADSVSGKKDQDVFKKARGLF